MSNPNEIPADGMQRSTRKFVESLIIEVEGEALTADEAMSEYDNYISRKPCPHDDAEPGGRR